MIAVYVLLRGGVFKQGESYYDFWDLFLILSMSHFVTLGQTSVCSSGTRLLYRNRNLSYLGALWSLINICRILWGAQRKLVTNIDSFSQSTYTLPTKTFCKPYPEAGIWDHRLHILFNLLCSACYQLCVSDHCPILSIHMNLQANRKMWRKYGLTLTLRAPLGSLLCLGWDFWLFPELLKTHRINFSSLLLV